MLLRGGRPDAELAASVAERLIAALSTPYRLRAGETLAGASVGVALYAPGLAEAAALIRRADDALYAAKRGGRGAYRFHEEAAPPRAGSATAAA